VRIFCVLVDSACVATGDGFSLGKYFFLECTGGIALSIGHMAVIA